MGNNPEEDEEEEYEAGNCKQSERNPVGGIHVWGNENAPTSAPSMLGIPGGATGRFTKQETIFSTEVNTPSAQTKSQALHRLLMRLKPMLHNTGGVVNVIGGGAGTTSSPTAGQQKRAGRGSTGWYALTQAVKIFGPAAIT